MEKFKILEYFSLPFNMSALLEVNLGVVFDLLVRGGGAVSATPGVIPHQRRQGVVRGTEMLPTLQREFLFRKLLGPRKEGKQEYSSGDSQRGTATSDRLPCWDLELSGVQTAEQRTKRPFCIENAGSDAFLLRQDINASSISEWSVRDASSPAGGGPSLASCAPAGPLGRL